MKPDLLSASDLDSTIARNARDLLSGVPERLVEAILYSLLGPGKRIRPRLVLAVSDAFAVPKPVAETIATAIELTHAYTLVHDDLPAMDNDDLRRGRPTNHKVYGEGRAILAGDSLALLGPEVLLGLVRHIPADRVVALTSVLLAAAGPRGVIAGQAAEMDLDRPASDPVRLYEIFRLKTGALFRAALLMPAIAAGADAAEVDALGTFGDALGIAFQIADDLEDDFTAKRSDPAHIASSLDARFAREEANRRLSAVARLSPRLKEALAPFIAELRRKIEGANA